ncbi:MAG: efflux RND transporter periplasmic adaptor subunit [Firmicutes bacterium]|nr:efflux RND transporter periplasmic adaptor subunit [Bacillota bacterium]
MEALWVPVWALLFGLGLPVARAVQGPGQQPSLVRYTEAREHTLRGTVTLPGTVEAATVSLVASTVEGLVVELAGREGRRVREGDVLARLRTVSKELELEAQRAALQEAEARLKLAEANLHRARELYESGVISRQQFDDAQSEFSAWQGRTNMLKATVARLEDELERMTIRAPFAGVVVRERTEVGQWVNAGSPVVEMVALDTVEIRVEVPERYYARLRTGSRVEVTLDALPGTRLSGRLLTVIPAADPQARTFPVKVMVENRSGRIGAGMLAQVSFAMDETTAATIVPKDAIVRQGPRTVIYRVNGDNTVEPVPVETGAAAGVWIAVQGPIRPGDKVVTRGNERLQPGQPVRAVPLEYELP